MDRIEALRTFLTVAEHGSFSEAARRLGISAGQVSKQVAALEHRLKQRLFERSTRSVRLSSEGEALLSNAQQIVDGMDRIEAEPTTSKDDLSGLVRITAPITYGNRRIVPLIASFMEQHPGVSVRLSLSDRKSDLIEEGFDVAVRVGENTDLALIGRKVTEESIRLLASDSYLAGAGAPTHPDQLQNHECLIDLNLPQPRRWRFQNGEDVAQVRVSGRMESDNAEAILASVQAGLGISLTPCWCLTDEQAHDGLTQLLPDWQAPAPEVWLLWPSSRYLPDRVRMLIDWIVQHLKD